MGLIEFLTAFENLKHNGFTDSAEKLTDVLKAPQDLTETLNPSIYARINSFFSFALCSPSGVALRSLALRIISKLAENPLNRPILVARFSILMPLANGIRLWQHDQIWSEVLDAFFKCTVDLHQMCLVPNDDVLIVGARQTVKLLQKSDGDQFSEIALGTLANFCRIPAVAQKILRDRSDFEALRKLLMRIMNSEPTNELALVFSMTIRFQLWAASDKFFEGHNFHTTVQVLFNILLNGDLSMASLFAGELLADLFVEQSTSERMKSYPHLSEALREIVCQLKSAKTPLLLKFLNLLSCIVRGDSGLCSFIRELIFSSPEVDGTPETGENVPCQGLAGLAVHLIKEEDHLLGAAATSFLLDLESSFAEPCVERAADYHGSLLALLTVLQRAISSCSSSVAEPFNNGGSNIEQLHRMRLTLRCAALVVNRLTQSVVGLDAESLEMSADQSFRLAVLIQSIAQQLFAGNDPLDVIAGLAGESAAASANAKHQSPPDAADLVQKTAVLAKAALTVECLDLMLACINHLSAVSPPPPPRSQSVIEDASETRIDSTPQLVENMTGLCLQEEPSAARLRRCGDALQHFLERPVMPSLLALTLAEGDGLFLPSAAPSAGPVAAWNYSLRLSALRLLPLALQLEKFSNQAFTDTLTALLPPDLGVVDRFLASKLLPQAQQKPDSRSQAFLTTWLLCTQPFGQFTHTEGDRSNRQQSNCTEEILEKLMSRFDGLEMPSVSGSEALAVCQRRIELLKSREGAVEANLTAKNEALTSALRESDQVVEQFRTRALLAEAEAARLGNLQLTALTERERDRTALADLTTQLNQLKAINADLSNDLAAKRQDCENLLATKQSLQNKLANSREQIRALDATNDNYRKQLDEAKQLLQQKDVQIQQYTQITRLINDLTGNRAPAIDLAASINLPNKTSSTNP